MIPGSNVSRTLARTGADWVLVDCEFKIEITGCAIGALIRDIGEHGNIDGMWSLALVISPRFIILNRGFGRLCLEHTSLYLVVVLGSKCSSLSINLGFMRFFFHIIGSNLLPTSDAAMHEAVPAIAACGVSPVVRIPDNQGFMVKRQS